MIKKSYFKHKLNVIKFLKHALLYRTIKAVPLQAWSGPECSRKLRFTDFMTLQDGR